MVVIAQTTLYFSLFSALGAALLAVLAKQWLLHYNSAGEFGSIEERGLQRQRKVNGMRRWKFSLVIQALPLLLQFSLLLFATALSIYLWTIHHAIAVISLTLTSLGSILYSVMVVSAVMSPDSPFQTSLSVLLKTILEELQEPPIPKWLRHLIRHTWDHVHSVSIHICAIFVQFWKVCTSPLTRMAPPFPMWHISKPRNLAPSLPVPIFGPPDDPSDEATAVLWTLETSTDPGLVEIAAELVPELQWPVNLDVWPAIKRLDDAFDSCLDYRDVLEGKERHATACIRAFWVLDLVTDDYDGHQFGCSYEEYYTRADVRELDAITFWTKPLDPSSSGPPITPWALRFIAAQNPSEEMLLTIMKHFDLHNSPPVGDKPFFADLMFCLNSCFSRTVARDRSVLEKR